MPRDFTSTRCSKTGFIPKVEPFSDYEFKMEKD